MSSYALFYITVPQIEMAQAMARDLLEKKLIACANILPQMQSIYHWQGQVQEDSEVVLLLKSRLELKSQITEAVLQLHSYDCPAILALPIQEGHQPFLNWMGAQTLDPRQAEEK